MSEEITRPKLICQYWNENEPTECIHWDTTLTSCTYIEEKYFDGAQVIIRATLYPLCNYIGTGASQCEYYNRPYEQTNGDGTQQVITTKPACTLPDPNRHVAKDTGCGTKWVVTKPQENKLDYSAINGYNKGKCNDEGTQVTCSGFKAFHLGFNTQPIQSSCIEVSEITSKDLLPSNYAIMNIRSRLAKCRWWTGEDTDFVLKLENGKLEVKAPYFTCKRDKTESEEFKYYKYEEQLQYQRPPCNGSAVDCKWYTGNLVESKDKPSRLSSKYLRSGDKILAEQILELRYNARKESWDKDKYINVFGNANMYSWDGVAPKVLLDENGNIADHLLFSVRSYIYDFTCFEIKTEEVQLSSETQSENQRPDYPDLVRELKSIPLGPVIRSVFETEEDATLGQNPNNDSESGEVFANMGYTDKKYVFETMYADHNSNLILGDNYFPNSVLFAINISDPDFVFPFQSILEYSSLYEMKKHMTDPDGKSLVFDKLEKDLDCFLNFIQESYPEKVYLSELVGNRIFYVDVKTFFGSNDILVFSGTDEFWEFDRIKFTKYFCGGVLAQTDFSITYPISKTHARMDTETIGMHPLFPYSMEYKFMPFDNSQGQSATAEYSYFDTKMQKPNTGFEETVTWLLGYTTYAIEILEQPIILDGCSIRSIGNSGIMYVVIEDNKKLHCLLMPWAVKGKIILKGTDGEGKDQTHEMYIMEHCTNRMEVNQMVIAPYSIDTYTRLYNVSIEIEQIYVYERHTGNYIPDNSTVIDTDILGPNTTIIRQTSDLEGDAAGYKLTMMPMGALVASIVFKGAITGRIKGQVKSELVIWLQQLYCRDVEIYYIWAAQFNTYDVLPTGYCNIDHKGALDKGNGVGGYAPACGDHYFGRISRRPSYMWYPYKACDAFASYNIHMGSGEQDEAPMEFWQTSTGRFDYNATGHGIDDIRMLGPAENYGITTDTHARVWDCSCDYTHTNSTKEGSNFFAGYGRRRSFITAEDMFYVEQNGGTGPKFGNKHRDYIMSFRSNAMPYYLKITDTGGVTASKMWCPIYETYHSIDFTNKFKEAPFKDYFNSGDNLVTYYNQIAVLAATGSVDNVEVGEAVQTDELRFEDVFRPHHLASAGLPVQYPEPRVQYTLGSETPVTISAWFTYKEHENGEIQCAWRGTWKKIERAITNMSNILYVEEAKSTCDLVGIYTKTGLSFLDVLYPNYTFDYKLNEKRRMVVEGNHVIDWYVSDYNSDLPAQAYYYLLRLDNGPCRVLNKNLSLVLDSTFLQDLEQPLFSFIGNEDLKKHIDFYWYCSDYSWLNGVQASMDLDSYDHPIMPGTVSNTFMVYDNETEIAESMEEAKTKAAEAGRVVLTTDGFIEVFNYYNTGLVINSLTLRAHNVPTELITMATDTYEYKITPTHDDSKFATVDPAIFYPAVLFFDIIYKETKASEAEMLFKYIDLNLVIDSINLIYNVGKGVEIIGKEEILVLYSVPKVIISTSVNGTDFQNIYESEFELVDYQPEEDTSILEKVEKKYEFSENTLDYLNLRSNFIKVKYKYVPEESDIKDKYNKEVKDLHIVKDAEKIKSIHAYYYDSIKAVYINTVELTYIIPMNRQENITTHERKYIVSVGGYGSIPIHGKNDTGSLLYPETGKPSIYQTDNSSGIVGWGQAGGDSTFSSVSKNRSRLGDEIKLDREDIPGDYDVYEKEQARIYNDLVSKVPTDIRLTSCLSEVLKDKLEKVGVTKIPTWSCTLKNTTVVPLEGIEPKSMYSPLGHLWKHDEKSLVVKFNCGGAIRAFTTTFEYQWGRVSGIFGYGYETDIFDLYSYGLSRVLTRWANQTDVAGTSNYTPGDYGG